MSSSTTNTAVTRNTLLMMGVEGAGMALGLGFDILTAATFGLGTAMDTFFVAQTIPQTIMAIITANGMRVLSPLFTEQLLHETPTKVHHLFSDIVKYSLLILTLGSFVLWLSSPIIFTLIAPGVDDQNKKIAVTLFQILLLTIPGLAITEPIRAFLIHRHKPVLAMLANILRFGIAIPILFYGHHYLGVFALSWAYVGGMFLQVSVFCILYQQQKGVFYWKQNTPSAQLYQLKERLGYPLAGELAEQSTILVERGLASYLSPGTVAAFGYARRILGAINALFANSIALALTPRITQETIQHNKVNLKKSLILGLQLTLFLAGTLTLVIVLGGEFIIATLFQRGAFDDSATELTTRIIQLFAPMILFRAAIQLFMIPDLASGKTKIIWILNLSLLGLSTLFGIIFVMIGQQAGLALSATISLFLITCVWGYTAYKHVH